jgi:hypothetical protein
MFQASPELLSWNGCGCFVLENNLRYVYDTTLDRAQVLERELQRFIRDKAFDKMLSLMWLSQRFLQIAEPFRRDSRTVVLSGRVEEIPPLSK